MGTQSSREAEPAGKILQFSAALQTSAALKTCARTCLSPANRCREPGMIRMSILPSIVRRMDDTSTITHL